MQRKEQIQTAPSAAPEQAPAISSDAPTPDAVWPRVLEIAGPRLRAMLDSMTVQQATPKLLRLGVPESRAAMARDHMPEIIRLVQQTGARSMSIQFVDLKAPPTHQSGQQSGQQGVPQADPKAGSQASDQAHAPEPGPSDADNHPLVIEAARVFGAKVTHIHPKRR